MNLEDRIIKELKNVNKTISTAESLTSGLVAATIANASGASKVFKGGIVSYSLEVKEKELLIPQKVMGEDAVNKETALLMAKNVSIKFDTDYGISTTGIAEKYDERNPQVYACVYDKENDRAFEYHFVFEDYEQRQEVREKVTKKLLKKFLVQVIRKTKKAN